MTQRLQIINYKVATNAGNLSRSSQLYHVNRATKMTLCLFQIQLRLTMEWTRLLSTAIAIIRIVMTIMVAWERSVAPNANRDEKSSIRLKSEMTTTEKAVSVKKKLKKPANKTISVRVLAWISLL